jgi:hypothetical protein
MRNKTLESLLHSGQITSGTYHCEAYILPLFALCGPSGRVSDFEEMFYFDRDGCPFLKTTTNPYEKAQTMVYTSFGL